MDIIKIKNLHASKDTMKKVYKQAIDLEKIFLNHISDKRLVLRILK